MNDYPMLFTPGRIGTAELQNRVVMTSFLTGLATKNGDVTDDLIAFYETRAQGGAGLIVTESAHIGPGGHNSYQLGAFDDSHIPGLKKLTDTVHKYGTAIFIQLYHPGCRQQTNLWAENFSAQAD